MTRGRVVMVYNGREIPIAPDTMRNLMAVAPESLVEEMVESLFERLDAEKKPAVQTTDAPPEDAAFPSVSEIEQFMGRLGHRHAAHLTELQNRVRRQAVSALDRLAASVAT